MESGWNDRRRVAEQDVTGPEKVADVAEMPVLNAPLAAVNDEQARGVALRQRGLGDEPLGQDVVEKVGLQVLGHPAFPGWNRPVRAGKGG